MNLAHDLSVNQFPPAESQKHLATWYTQGHSDAFGDRLLMFDNTTAPSWEILRFKPALARIPAFERALRDRLTELRSFQHHAFPIVRYIDELGRDDGLAVASTYSAGFRLSEALHKTRSAAFAVRLMGELVPAVAALQRHRQDTSHGALTLDRIVITAEGRLAIREHIVGSALASLGLSAEQLRAEFGIATFAAAEAIPPLDNRNDVVQIALIAMSLMAGRRIGPGESLPEIDRLLDELTDLNAASITNPEALRAWLRRALQIAPNAFESARDASDALAELRDAGSQSDGQVEVRAAALDDGSDASMRGPRLVASRLLNGVDRIAPIAEEEVGAIDVAAGDGPDTADTRTLTSRGRFRLRIMTAVAIGTAAVAGAEMLVIGRTLQARPPIPPPAPAALSIDSPEPGTQVWVDGQLVGSTPFELKVDPRVHSVRLRPPDAVETLPPVTPPIEDTRPVTKKDETGSGGRLAATSQKSGGFQLTSPIDLYVLDGERLLGVSSDGPIFAPAGSHELDFVNTSIGFRTRRTVNIKPGQISTVSVAVPNGTLNINAVPWASVWVDGSSAGDTPIGNLSVAPGQHEIVFRHPQLGERRQKTIVRADGPTRVTTNLQR